jgi:hypothetical protein
MEPTPQEFRYQVEGTMQTIERHTKQRVHTHAELAHWHEHHAPLGAGQLAPFRIVP